MNESELNSLLNELLSQNRETEWLEFKQNNFDPREIGEYISALANAASYNDKPFGYLVFGVDDNLNVNGTIFKPKQEKIGNQELENWLITQLNPPNDFQIFEFDFFTNQIVIFKIDAALNTPVEFKGEAYIRVGSYKKKLKDHPEKERKIWTKVANYTFEKGIAERGLSDDDVLNLLDYPSYFNLTKQNLPANKNAIIEKFVNEKIIIQIGQQFAITNLGAILFAKNLANFDSLERKAVRVIVYNGNDKLKTVKEQVGKKGYASGFNGLISFVTDQLPSNEQIGKAFREQIKIYPSLAIRELVANAIIHQDFSVKGSSPMIEIYNNRIEISNPGKPIIPTSRFIDHNSESRNEVLAKFMRRMNICEERGSGIDKVVSECEIFQLPAPNFMEGDNYLKVIMYSPKTLREMDKNDKLRACYQHCVLKYITGEFMTNETLRKRFDVDDKNYPMVSRIISMAKEDKFIKDYSVDNKSPKYAKYIPIWA
ncbi:MAG: putative DNA binding domain-containing protein [Ferruginibacter sp.]|nr:putative DNA binding domain-containing protein [Ferruginibacter sp.]